MAKKYLSLEEAAEYLGISVAELKAHRENGDLRGFADRATWKFRMQDIEEFGRNLRADSSPDIPLLDSVLSDDEISEQPTIIRHESIHDDDDSDLFGGPSDSDVRLVMDDDLLAAQNTFGTDPEIQTNPDSDSDVRLFDDSDPALSKKRSDSDVRLVGDTESDIVLQPEELMETEMEFKMEDGDDVNPFGSDSDVKLVDDEDSFFSNSDSDVKLVGGPGSESDVQLIGTPPVDDSDSGISLVSTDDDESGISLGIADSGIASSSVLDDDESIFDEGMTMAAGSGILQSPADSGISLETADSGITLEGTKDSGISLDDDQDSGISLGGNDSGISLEADSGISLDGDSGSVILSDDSEFSWDSSDSGIALEAEQDSGIGIDEYSDSGISLGGDDDDSGISVGSAADSGIALEAAFLDDDDDDLNDTFAMLDAEPSGDDLEATQLEVPLLGGMDDDEDFALSGTDLDIPVQNTADSDTGVIVFDDDEEVDDYSPTTVGTYDELDGDDFDMANPDNEFDMSDDFDDFDDDDDLDVAGDEWGDGDEELDELDVFNADDDDFDDGFSSGTSHAEFTAPAMGSQGMVMAAPQAEWGVGTFLGVLTSTALLAVCATVMYDLLRTMWAWDQPTTANAFILDTLRGMF